MKARCTLHANEATGAGVRRIANAMIGDALRRGRRTERAPTQTVHLFRTTTKRLRALLLLIRPVIARTTFERENARLKRIADRLAPLRDHTVAIETLKSLGDPSDILRQGIVTSSCRPASPNPSPGRALDRAARELDQARGRFQKLRIRGDGWEIIGPGLIKVYRQARRRMTAAVVSHGDPAFHRWRIRVKQLAYQLQWLEAVWPQRFARMLKQLRRLEESLGRDHDLFDLRSLLRRVRLPADGGGEINRVLKALKEESRKLKRASEHIGTKIFRESPRKFRQSCRKHWRSWLP
ncbi:MAG: CHAD domain-containing protein [Chthoniobacter sp.]|nr:CHAD domain-containing protein [Chthoniobacter sp.]